MKIALLDLNHRTRGIHTNTVPLGLGLIATYLRKNVKADFDIKIFKDADKVLEVLKGWAPDIMGIAQYTWNSELNLYFARMIKRINPNCLVVAGGPNLDISKPRRKAFLKKEGSVDVCVLFDGEIPFTEIVRRLLKKDSVEDIRKYPAAGSYSLDPETGEMVESLEAIPRLETLDEFGTVYADGVFEQMLNDGFHPFVQTHRGCPFECTFCHTSDRYYSRVIFQSPEIFKADMEYLGRKFLGKDNIILYIANTNMSLFKEDFPIAEIIRRTKEKYGWPKVLNVNSGKDPNRLLEMLSVIEFRPAIALQTLTPEPLKNVKRKNIPFEDFVAFQEKVSQKTNEMSATELILCLPGETKESFIRTLKTVMNSNIQSIVVFTLMNLKGTPLCTDESAERWGHTIRHRVVPRQFSRIEGTNILDTEEVIVATKTLPYEDYLELRGLCFSITVFFSSIELIPLKNFLRENKIDIAQWIFNIHKNLSSFPDIYSSYKEFLKETEQELFVSKEALEELFKRPENYKALREGRLGDNLLRKYKCIVLSRHYSSFLELAISEARAALKRSSSKAADETDLIIGDLKAYLSTRDMKQYFVKDKAAEERAFGLNYDIQSWLDNVGSDISLYSFKGSFDYSVRITDSAKRRFCDIVEMNKDPELSLQILYRDGITKEFWPIWTKKEQRIKDEILR